MKKLIVFSFRKYTKQQSALTRMEASNLQQYKILNDSRDLLHLHIKNNDKTQFYFILFLQKEYNDETDLKNVKFLFKKMHWLELYVANNMYKCCWEQNEMSCRYFSNLNLGQQNFSRWLWEVSLHSVVAIKNQYNSLKVTFWTVSALELWIKQWSAVVKVSLLFLSWLIFSFSNSTS